MDHLNDDLMAALDRGEPEAVSYFRDHLASACDSCERYLAEARHPALDALADLQLLRAALRQQDGAGFPGLRRQLGGRSRQAIGAAVAVAAAAALAIVLIPAAPSDEGVKGGGLLTLEVSAALSAADGSVIRVDSSQTLPSSGILLLRYHASEAAKARVYRQQEDGSRTLLGEVALEAGSHELPTGISLEGEEGRTTFYLEAGTERGRSAKVELTFDIQED